MNESRFAPFASLLVALLLPATAVVGETEPDSARAWLMRMAMAVEDLNYQGRLVHLHGEDADILNIVHRVHDGRVEERITALDGPGREIIRNDDEVTCIFPDQRSVLVEPRDASDRSQSPLQGRLPRPNAFDERQYALELDGHHSAAGRSARLLTVRARDGYRYGYELWLDEETGMPLKARLLDSDGKTVEQIMFTDIRILDRIPPEAVQASLDTANFEWQRSVDAPMDQAGMPVRWRATRLPDGFRQVAARARLAPGAKTPTEQFVFTDGLATVSVFVDMMPPGDDEREGISSMGAASAYTAQRGEYMVTAVGEVPVRTVELIARSMRPDETGH